MNTLVKKTELPTLVKKNCIAHFSKTIVNTLVEL